ncbi:tyrosine-type recombinase/integrase [Lactobacillus crispatus]|jgi:lj965 prophage integrase|uniref:tyrosine-type recombinase/integrase n=1 Tax=Lactobacillus crispatus TaxID=47770 RepID=UPI0010615EA2|nr:site-specific integrase [Lactobacillus crispatus]TDN13300.1 site-specific integrase [Lactobacillus crispatus]WAZ54215.1 tyrosine-type recombinase/integrase [Lactobacillus crispatus]DAJ15643.1 MAG TPA: Integrase [Siphoviridae sp. ctBfm1]
MPKRKNTAIKPYKLKSGKKRYMFYIYLGQKNGQKVQTFRRGFKSYEEADAVYKQLAATNPQDFVKQKQYTVDQLWNEWFKRYVLDVKPSTAQKTYELYNLHIKPEFGESYVDSLTTKTISDYFYSLANEYKRYRTVFNYLHKLLEYAVDIELINRNPARSSLLPKKSAVKGRDTSHNFYTLDELKAFLDTAKEISDQVYFYFLILATTGIRKSEAIALHWSDFNYENKTIQIQRTTAYKLKIKGNGEIETNDYGTQIPKGNETRVVPMSDLVYEVSLHCRKDLNPLVFHNTKGDYYRSSKADKWKKQIYEKNPNLKKITVHGLRHSFATIANDNGWNMVDVKNVLGHKSIDLTLGTYTHTTKNGEEEIRKDINGLF